MNSILKKEENGFSQKNKLLENSCLTGFENVLGYSIAIGDKGCRTDLSRKSNGFSTSPDAAIV